MWNIDGMKEYYAMTYSADQLSEAMHRLADERRSVGCEAEIDKGADEVIRGALLIAQVHERVEDLLPERSRDAQLDPRG